MAGVISRKLLVHPSHRRHVTLSALSSPVRSQILVRCRLQSSKPHRTAIAITNSNLQSEIPSIPNPNPSSTPSLHFSDQVLDDIPPSSKYNAPTTATRHPNVRSIFPWRHSPRPLPRLVAHTVEEHEEGGEFGPRFPISGGAALSSFERGVFWYGSLYVLGLTRPWGYARWKTEMEDGFLSAFALGLQGVLIDVYRAPTSYENDDEIPDHTDDTNSEENDEDDHEYNIYVDHIIDKSSPASNDDTSSNDNTDTTAKQQISTKTTNPPSSQHNDNDDDDKQNSPYNREEEPDLHDMLETNLQSLYHSAHRAAKSKLNIHLQCQPKSCHLISLFTVPLVTREEVSQTPSLRNLYPDLYRKLLHRTMEEMERTDGRRNGLSWRQVYAEIREFVEDKVENRQEDVNLIQMTVVAQAVIECDEVFCVRDVETGKVVQGDADGKVKTVPHLVRFEMVVNWDLQQNILHTGTWQITDWDDLLDGNIWYL